MKAVLRGLVAGLLAGLLIACLSFVDYGPGNSLYGAANWFALGDRTSGRLIGFLLLIVLGGIFGMLFAVSQGRRQVTLGRSLAYGLATGVVWWMLVVLLLGTVIYHTRLNFSAILFSIVLLLVYGLVLGALYTARTHAP